MTKTTTLIEWLLPHLSELQFVAHSKEDDYYFGDFLWNECTISYFLVHIGLARYRSESNDEIMLNTSDDDENESTNSQIDLENTVENIQINDDNEVSIESNDKQEKYEENTSLTSYYSENTSSECDSQLSVENNKMIATESPQRKKPKCLDYLERVDPDLIHLNTTYSESLYGDRVEKSCPNPFKNVMASIDLVKNFDPIEVPSVYDLCNAEAKNLIVLKKYSMYAVESIALKQFHWINFQYRFLNILRICRKKHIYKI